MRSGAVFLCCGTLSLSGVRLQHCESVALYVGLRRSQKILQKIARKQQWREVIKYFFPGMIFRCIQGQDGHSTSTHFGYSRARKKFSVPVTEFLWPNMGAVFLVAFSFILVAIVLQDSKIEAQKNWKAIFEGSFCTQLNTIIVNKVILGSIFFLENEIEGKQKEKTKVSMLMKPEVKRGRSY